MKSIYIQFLCLVFMFSASACDPYAQEQAEKDKQLQGGQKPASHSSNAVSEQAEAQPELEEPIIVPFQPSNDFNNSTISLTKKYFGKDNNLIASYGTTGITVGDSSLKKPTPNDSIYRNPNGNYICVYLNQKLVAVKEQTDTIAVNELFSGVNLLTAFICRPSGESIKGSSAFCIDSFEVKPKAVDKKRATDAKKNLAVKDTTKPDTIRLTDPAVYICSPVFDTYSRSTSKNILLDFQVRNVELADSLFKIRVSINGKNIGTIYDTQPKQILGLKKGDNLIKLEILKPDGKKAEGILSISEKTIKIID